MPLQIIGAGLGRTGTLSLKLAIEQLGFGPCYHMVEFMSEPGRSAQWIEAAAGRLDWEAVFEGYAATVDYPGCVYWRELAERYPSAKVVLTIRDADQWFESTQATIFSPPQVQRLSNSPMKEFFEKTVRRDYGERLHDRDFMTERFRSHNRDVERAIPKERLLVYEVSQGWEPLCELLGVPVPDAPFPRLNSREEFAARSVLAAARAAGSGSLDMREMSEQARRRLESLKAKHAPPSSKAPRLD